MRVSHVEIVNTLRNRFAAFTYRSPRKNKYGTRINQPGQEYRASVGIATVRTAGLVSGLIEIRWNPLQ